MCFPHPVRLMLPLVALICLLSSACVGERPDMANAIELDTGWHLQAAARCPASPEQIAGPDLDLSGWYPTAVPSTVLAALVSNGVYQDPYFGKGLEEIDSEQFAQPWWYRTTFELADPGPARHIRLLLDGVNYRAEIWLNGRRIAGEDEIFGAFRRFDLALDAGILATTNVLAIKVSPPQPGDPTIGFVDWNPTPPDRNMGLWRGVSLRVTGAVSLDNLFVQSDLDLETLASAELSISGDLSNHSDQPASGMIKVDLEGDSFYHPYQLAPGEHQQLVISPLEHAQLTLDQPRLWWPNQLGEPNLYQLEVETLVGEQRSDTSRLSFGIREVEDYLNQQGHRGYRVNGREVLIRGGGWVDDLMLADDERKIESQLRYARHMNLNTIRLEGFWGSSHTLYDLADRYGILLMAGWSCQWEWPEYLGKPVDEQYGGITSDADIDLIARSLRDQVQWLRNHPSLFVWVLASDLLPHPELEKSYYRHLAEVDPTRPALSSCAWRTSEVSGPSGAKMNGPYDYVTPNYWYLDRTRGGAFGFNTETGPGPQPPPLSSIKRMIPEQHLWPIDEMWEYHCGRHEFNTLDRYLHAFNQRYGPAVDLPQFAFRAQAANYEAMRAMFEAFAVNRPQATGVIQWMLNSAWPEMYWQLYDHYLMPNGAFYATRKACQPLSLVYSYGDHRVYGVNTTHAGAVDLTAEIRLLGLDGGELLAENQPLELMADSSQPLFELPEREGLPAVYFLDLRLRTGDGETIASNFYWLSATPDVLDEAGSTWFYTPNRSFADFSALTRLPAVEVAASHRIEEQQEQRLVELSLHNRSSAVAFFIELQLLDQASGEPILPVFWEDNYLSLLPGEQRRVTATVDRVDRSQLQLVLSGWNLPPTESVAADATE